ncbi:bifunctional DNA-formamidopyrimidine glycosylase/DNA-(apurinic or apyrimidinic site) lyase [Candidatus Microgenomates bacterium]|jgi:formamidopyrimidine-DNA glycosylase|nr:MAG: bifunctional DNA-formamidopyrimidine glycosylase/DNA-(apurinic or apyrimidinic site) lyase [Candidatus Microgenomates bacterium]
MPELPEVETIKRQLDVVLKGLRIERVKVINPKCFQGDQKQIEGQKVKKVSRRAKITFIELENGLYLAIHLKLTGQLIFRKKEEKEQKFCDQKEGPFAVCELPNKFTRVIIRFDKGNLFYNDLRMFGWIKIVKSLEEVGGEKLGPEAIDEKEFSFDYLKKVLAKTSRPVKIIIMDQQKIAGIGNIYANEALFKAGILPSRSSSSLKGLEIKKLRESIISVLKEAIEKKGTSDKDEAFRQITGEKGSFQNCLMVYGKAGEDCPGCKGKIKRISLGGRGTFFCEECQN